MTDAEIFNKLLSKLHPSDTVSLNIAKTLYSSLIAPDDHAREHNMSILTSFASDKDIELIDFCSKVSYAKNIVICGARNAKDCIEFCHYHNLVDSTKKVYGIDRLAQSLTLRGRVNFLTYDVFGDSRKQSWFFQMCVI
jgi:hypothetical protein